MADVSFSHILDVRLSEPPIQLSERLVALAPPRVRGLLQQSMLEERLMLRSGHGRAVCAVAPPRIATQLDVDEIVDRIARAVGRFEERLPACMST